MGGRGETEGKEGVKKQNRVSIPKRARKIEQGGER